MTVLLQDSNKALLFRNRSNKKAEAAGRKISPHHPGQRLNKRFRLSGKEGR